MFDLIKDKSFEIQNTKDYILSIQVCLDGFSFLMFNQEEKKIVAYKTTQVLISSENLLSRRLKEWLDEEDLLKNQFKSVRAIIFTNNFALVPIEYSGSEWNRSLTSAVFDRKVHNLFEENKINAPEANLFFPVSQDIRNVLYHFFTKNTEIIHPLTCILNSGIKSKKSIQSFVLATNKFFYLTISRNNRLLFANSFSINHENDLVYNIINAFQQLEIARSETDLVLAGSKAQNAEIKTLLKPYFLNISNLEAEEFISNPEIVYNSLQLYLSLI